MWRKLPTYRDPEPPMASLPDRFKVIISGSCAASIHGSIALTVTITMASPPDSFKMKAIPRIIWRTTLLYYDCIVLYYTLVPSGVRFPHPSPNR